MFPKNEIAWSSYLIAAFQLDDDEAAFHFHWFRQHDLDDNKHLDGLGKHQMIHLYILILNRVLSVYRL